MEQPYLNLINKIRIYYFLKAFHDKSNIFQSLNSISFLKFHYFKNEFYFFWRHGL